ncbi:MAG: endonuclease/exonuclease/phosphatase (EEP) superfamily protein YafD [Psychromonas sp.]|jgi:endonuclease/exonuclease/phosphatase (EEP) superfamily protein YafD|uniref:endonuclease/exonuclease/phosphatase family protein n=1 Tax=Psychromonas sp. TaxID=1884585 RepID=UPI0039E48622
MKKRFKQADYFIENHEYSQKTLINSNISLLNWNIQKRNSDPLWAVEFKHIIERYTPEVVLLQECQFENGLERIFNFQHYGFIFAPNFLDIFKSRHSGVLTASTANHQSVSVIKSHALEPLIKVPKIFLATTYAIDNTDSALLVLNIHAINFVGFWKFISQIQQLEYAIRSHQGPIILSGDFNTWNRKRTHILDEILTESGLAKVQFHKAHQKNIKKFLFNNSLDHIYYRGLELDGPPEVVKTKSSDHNPLLVKFKLNLFS